LLPNPFKILPHSESWRIASSPENTLGLMRFCADYSAQLPVIRALAAIGAGSAGTKKPS